MRRLLNLQFIQRAVVVGRVHRLGGSGIKITQQRFPLLRPTVGYASPPLAYTGQHRTQQLPRHASGQCLLRRSAAKHPDLPQSHFLLFHWPHKPFDEVDSLHRVVEL